MGIKYSREETIKECQKALNNDIAVIYNADCINWRGKTTDSHEFYSEIISKGLIESKIIKKLSSIKPIERKKYNVKHTGKFNNTNRQEEGFAIELFNYCKNGKELPEIGKIINYQVPLKASQKDKVGKIDLVSYNESEKIAYLLELKYIDNVDTLLRCALEITTYYQLLNKKNLKESYPELKNSDIKKGILVFKGLSQHNEVEEIKSGLRPRLKELLDELKVEIFLIDGSMEVEHILL